MTAEPTTDNALVNITDAAAEKAKALLIARDLPEGALRVFVAGGGCSGYQYGMALARSTEDDDIMKSGFSIFNPNATKSCACGSSFQTQGGEGSPRACC